MIFCLVFSDFVLCKSTKCTEVLYRGHLKRVCENVVVRCPLTILVSSEFSPAHNDMHVNPDALLVYPQNTARRAKKYASNVLHFSNCMALFKMINSVITMQVDFL